MNTVILTGRLTADPEVRKTQGGETVCKFRLAVNRDFKNAKGEREADFVGIVAWRQLGDLCAKYLQKGDRCGIRGRIQTGSYQGNDGVKRYTTDVVADALEFLDNKREGEGQTTGTTAPAMQTGGFDEIDEDDLPF